MNGLTFDVSDVATILALAAFFWRLNGSVKLLVTAVTKLTENQEAMMRTHSDERHKAALEHREIIGAAREIVSELRTTRDEVRAVGSQIDKTRSAMHDRFNRLDD